MGTIYMILAVVILRNAVSGHYTGGCSLLPGGEQKCFSDYVVDSESKDDKKKTKEINFHLGKYNIFAYDINFGPQVAGANLRDVRIGKHYVERVGKLLGSSSVKCTKSRPEAYLPQYAPYLYDYSLDDKGKARGQTLVTKLFKITKKEVWKCENGPVANNLIVFDRVVTEMVSLVPLGTVFFFDGIEVATAPVARLKKDQLVLNSTIIREVKYIDSFERIVHYEGHFEFKKPVYNNYEDASLFKPVKPDENREPEKDKMMYHAKIENELGPDLVDVQRPDGEIGRKDSIASCQNLEKDERLFHINEYFPHWAERISFQKLGDRIRATTLKNFYEEYIVTRHEIWSCKIENPTHEDGDGKFERHVLEYIGLKQVKTVDYYFFRTKVWRYKLVDLEDNYYDWSDPNFKQSVAVRSTFYFTKEGNYQRKYYWGKFRLQKNSVPEEEPKSWFTKLFSSTPENDIKYELDYDEAKDEIILERERKH